MGVPDVSEDPVSVTVGGAARTPAERVWQDCAASVAEVSAAWSTRDVIIHAVESFARSWDIEFGFGIHDPNDVKELARWIGQHLEAVGVPARR